MKRKMCKIVIILAIIQFMSYFVGTGFVKRTDMALGKYTVSEDGKNLNFQVGVVSSVGYTRGFKDCGGGEKPHYLIFYSTFGGLNSSFGATNEFELELGKDDKEIYFCRPDGGYELVLEKNADTGEWLRPEEAGFY